MQDRKNVNEPDESNNNTDSIHSSEGSSVVLKFQELDMYRCAIDLVSLAYEAGESMPRGYAKLVNQLDRASWSIPLNIAEGYGKITRRDKANYYSIARGSAMECAAIFDVLKRRGLTTEADHAKAVRLADRIVAMLSKMCS